MNEMYPPKTNICRDCKIEAEESEIGKKYKNSVICIPCNKQRRQKYNARYKQKKKLVLDMDQSQNTEQAQNTEQNGDIETIKKKKNKSK